MPSNETTTKFKADISQLKSQMQAASRAVKVATSEFKAATAGMDNWSRSADGLEAKLKQLDTVYNSQNKQLNLMEEELKKTVKVYGENSAAADQVRIKINNQKAAIAQTEKQINQYTKELNDCKNGLGKFAKEEDQAVTASDKLKKTISDQKTELAALKKAYADAKLDGNAEDAEKYAKAIKELSSELKNNETKLAQAEKAADEFDNSLEDVDDSAERAKEGFTVMKGALASLVADGIRLALRAMKDLAVETFNAGANFESSMSKVQAISGASADDIAKLTQKAKDMGETTVFSASESADALQYMAMAGWKTDDMLNGLEGIMNLAAASGEDLATTSDIVTDALTAMGYSAGDAGKFADVMAAASSNANTNVKLMGNTFQYVAPIAGALGYNIEDTAVAIGLMANAGIKGEKAGTALRSTLTRLSAPPKECADAMEELGLSLTDEAGNMKELDVVMGDLRKAFSGLSETQQTQYAKSIAGQEAMSGLLAIVNAAPEDFDKLTKAVNNSTGAAKNMADTMTDNVNGQITLLKSNIEGKMIKVFEKASGSIKKAVKSMGQSLDSLDWDKFSDGVGKLAQKFADFVGFVARNTPLIVTVLKTLGAVMISVFAVNKIATFANSIKTLTPLFTTMAAKIGLVTVATEGQTAATVALNTAWLASPITWVIGALAALTVGIIAYTKHVNNQVEAEYGLSEAQKENVENCKALKSEYDQMNQARNESNNAITSEYGYLTQLKNEYNSLVDSNGNIKQGYEDRANFILNELAKALGVEVSQIKEQIDANGKLSDSIDQIIEKKKAEALLSANQDAYNQAIKERTKAFEEYSKAQETVAEAEKKWKSAQEEYNAVMETHNTLLKTNPEAASGFLLANQEIIKGQEKAKESYDEAKSALAQSEEAYIGYNNTISNYEGLSSAIISGDTDKINQAMANLTYNFKTAENSNRESLEQQVKDMNTNYENMKKAIESNTPGVTQEMVDQAKSMVTASEKELMKLEGKASATGKQSGMNFGLNLGAQDYLAADGGKALANSGLSGAEYNNGDFGGAGADAGGAYAFGVASEQGDAKNAGEGLADNAEEGSKDHDSYGSGSFFGQGFFNGIGSWLSDVWERGKELAKNALSGLRKGQEEGSPSKLTRQSGVFFGEGYELGINETLKSVVKSATNLAIAAYDALDDSTSDFDKLGMNAGSSFSDGLKASLSDVKKSINDVAIPLDSIKLDGQIANAAVNSGISQGNANVVVNGNQKPTTQNLTFNQYNTSPKQLSRLEIYRDTNSLLFGAKARLNNV